MAFEVSLSSDTGAVLLTGASSGLGQALALTFARLGRPLHLLGRDSVRLEATAELCRKEGVFVSTYLADVRDRQRMSAVVEEADSRKPLGIVIANAGIGGRAVLTPACGEVSDVADDLIDINLRGVIHTLGPAIQPMLDRRRGTLVVIGSLAGFVGLPSSPLYSGVKAALRAYTDGLSSRLRVKGIDVTLVSPGFIATPMSQSLEVPMPFLQSPEKAAERIVRGLDRGAAHIAFPRRLWVAAAAVSVLPTGMRRRILRTVDKGNVL